MKPERDYFGILEFTAIQNQLQAFAVTDTAKVQLLKLQPILSEVRLRSALRETGEARRIIDMCGNPPIPKVAGVEQLLEVAEKEGLLVPAQLERMQVFSASCRRLKSYLKRAEGTGESLAYTGEAIDPLEEVYQEINRCIRGEDIDSNASQELCRIRRAIDQTEQQMKAKLEELLKSRKAWMTDSFISLKNGRYTLPVKKEYKNQFPGTVVAVSATGGTCFMEPYAAVKLSGALEQLREEEGKERERILYSLTALIYQYREELKQNIELIIQLDFAFAKGKFSVELDAVEPMIHTERRLKITKGRHPLLNRESCVPLDFELGNEIRGIVITGPNTGGKTVALKLIGLFALMAQSGLHLPCENAEICMNSNVLCDIGDGQNISENLSTFSAHIKNIVDILSRTGRESLVLLDELGSGTDPEEGMGLAVAVLEELRLRQCLFVATTHYVEVKTYAEETEALSNARMSFDQETLQPMYQLVIGEAGESCAFYIARKFGLPEQILERAAVQVEKRAICGGKQRNETIPAVIPAVEENSGKTAGRQNHAFANPAEKIQKAPKERKRSEHAACFQMGDSVIVYPEKVVGIVYQPSDENGVLTIQIKGKKQRVNHKRLKLKASAKELYPENYDYSIIFDTVEQRKGRHQMERKYCKDLEIKQDKRM